MPKTPLQMPLRGQNLGYRHYADDVVERFVERAQNGMTCSGVFDAMNDPRT